MTRGHKSSERKAAYHATFLGVCILLFGIYHGADLSGLGVAIGIVLSPISFLYPASRTIVKAMKGEKDV